MQNISPSQLKQWLSESSPEDAAQVLLLDVREPWEVERASLSASAGVPVHHLPMGQLMFRFQELNREQPTICICHHGGRSAQVAYFLEQQGFDSVFNLSGGINAWSQSVDPAVPLY